MATNTDADARTTTDERPAARAKWESFSYEIPMVGMVIVRNHSHGDDVADDHKYVVNVHDGRVTGCTCPDHKHRNRTCKHMHAVDAHDAVRDAADGAVDVTDDDAAMIDAR